MRVARFIAVLTAAAIALAVPRTGAAQPLHPQHHIQRDLREAVPAARVTAHEWGVFVLEQGQLVHLQEIAAELPPFVHRGNGPLGGALPPPVIRPGGGTLARKPVLFLYADAPVDVRVEVGFAGGAPWFHYPAGHRVAAGLAAGAPGLVWDVRIEPHARVPFAPAPPGHFWEDLRRGGGRTVVAADGTAEAFIFYDGPVDFQRPFLIGRHGTGAAVTPSSSERTIFIVDRGMYAESDVDPRSWTASPRGTGDAWMLRARLDAELRARGLTPGESASLLDTWRDDLFTDPRPRAIYFVPRDMYDRMLPIRITPEPVELVRVGLVIHRM